MKLSAIILAMTTTEELFEMTSNCISSLMTSESAIEMEIIIIESNKNYLNSSFKYPELVKIIIPESDFNFHKFLNIGIKASTGEYVALCNNDLIFYNNWFSQILKVKEENPSIKSFSPSGKIDDYSFSKTFELGYKVRTHVMGWCIVANREVFPRIGFLDETFDFNYADNDYAMTLKKYNIKHALVNTSKVEHLEREKRNEKKEDVGLEYKKLQSEINLSLIDLPKYVFLDEYKWLFQDEKGLSDHIKFHKKWGLPNLLYKKNKVADILIRFKLGFFNRFVLGYDLLNLIYPIHN
jgi:GT2 family glycosyltransferase